MELWIIGSIAAFVGFWIGTGYVLHRVAQTYNDIDKILKGGRDDNR